MSRSRDISIILGSTEAINSDNTALGIYDGGVDSGLTTQLIDSSYVQLRQAPGEVTVYTSLDSLPVSSLTSGDQAFVLENNRLYISNGLGWYNVSLVNLSPTFDSDINSTFTIVDSATPLIITNPASDSDNPDAIISYGGTMSDSGQYLIVLTRDSSVWTFTPRSADSVYDNVTLGNIPDSNGGNFTYTFTASDGINQASKEITITYTDLAAAVTELTGTVATTSNSDTPTNTASYFGTYVQAGGDGTTGSTTAIASPFSTSHASASGGGVTGGVVMNTTNGTNPNSSAGVLVPNSYYGAYAVQGSGDGIHLSEDGLVLLIYQKNFETTIGNQNQGGIHIYYRTANTTWTLQASYTGASGSDNFGEVSCMSGNGRNIMTRPDEASNTIFRNYTSTNGQTWVDRGTVSVAANYDTSDTMLMDETGESIVTFYETGGVVYMNAVRNSNPTGAPSISNAGNDLNITTSTGITNEWEIYKTGYIKLGTRGYADMSSDGLTLTISRVTQNKIWVFSRSSKTVAFSLLDTIDINSEHSGGSGVNFNFARCNSDGTYLMSTCDSYGDNDLEGFIVWKFDSGSSTYKQSHFINANTATSIASSQLSFHSTNNFAMAVVGDRTATISSTANRGQSHVVFTGLDL